MNVETWNEWNQGGGPKYPHEKVVQFCFRNYPPATRSGVRALDLGCGSGVHCAFLAREGFEVTGTDVSDVGVENTRRRLASEGLAATLRCESADVLGFPAASFDLVISTGVLDSAGPIVAEAAIAKLPVVLAPKARGAFLFASDRDFRVAGDNPYGLHGYSESEVQKLFDVGFDTVWIDRYITTYEGGRIEQNDWLVTLRR